MTDLHQLVESLEHQLDHAREFGGPTMVAEIDRELDDARHRLDVFELENDLPPEGSVAGRKV